MATTVPAPTAAPAGQPAPGPSSRNIARVMARVRLDPLAELVRVSQRYGDVSTLRMPAALRLPQAELMLVRNGDHARRILITNQDNYHKPLEYRILGVLLGEGLLTTDNAELWRRQRRLVQPMFAKRHLGPFAEHMTAAAAQTLDRWGQTSSGRTIDAAEAMNAITLDVVGRALFGSDLSGPVAETVGSAMTTVLRAGIDMARAILPRVGTQLPGVTLQSTLKVHPFRWRRTQQAVSTLDEVVWRLIAERRAHPDDDQENLLSLLLAVRDDETGEPMPDEQVRDEIMTFLAAGHETTANAMAWMWMLLSQHPDVRDRMHEEIDTVLQGRVPTAADADLLPYTLAVVQESMRLYPPVWIIVREPYEDDQLGDVAVPAGTPVAILTYLVHRDPAIWTNPEGFDPNRFLPGAPPRPRHAFMPFGAGRRVCVGSGFALMEGVLLTAMIAQRFQLDLAPAARIIPEATITLRPKHGIPMTLTPRHV
jgi:cytochrome P450